jgi:hypothetical protein
MQPTHLAPEDRRAPPCFILGGWWAYRWRLQAFLNVIRSDYRCQEGVLIVEQIHEIWDFKQFLEPLGVVFSGLVPTSSAPSVCHSWRFVTRVELFRARGAEDWAIDQDILGIAGDQWGSAHDLDVVLLLKQWARAPD